MAPYTSHDESPFSEGQEQELAAELLAATSDHELDQFLSGLLRRAASVAKSPLRSPIGRALGAWAKGAVRKILPGAGHGFDGVLDSVVSRRAGQLAANAGRVLGMEFEGLSAEDQEFNAARQLVRLAGTAAARAVANTSTRSPEDIARQAMIEATRLHAPGLVRAVPQRLHSNGCGQGGACACQRNAAGSWERRGRHIVLHGI